jgi:hypothetical protein
MAMALLSFPKDGKLTGRGNPSTVLDEVSDNHV